jgi:hypothetical protein
VKSLPEPEVVRIDAHMVDAQVDTDVEGARWRERPPAAEPSQLPETCIVLDPAGDPIMLRTRLPQPIIGPYRRAVIDYPCLNDVVRGAGIRNRAQVFGNLARSPVLRRLACQSCSGARTHPDQHAVLCNTASLLAALLAHYLPNQHAANTHAIAVVHPDWRLPGGLWTSGVLNETSALPFHRDRNNVDAWSAMVTIRRQVRGGHLLFPEMRLPDGSPLVLPCGDGDAVFFNGQRWLHGVTPMRKVAKSGYRYSAVYYPLKRMKNCLPFEDELRQLHLTRTANEDTLLARQTAAGYLSAAAAEVGSLGVHDDVDDE